jgi:hypothetical protein
MSDTVSLRVQRLKRREAEARQRGYAGEWPPPRVRLTCAADVEDCLARLEAGELRAGFISGLTFALVRLFPQLGPEHFRRFGRLLAVIAENRQAAHRSRLQAVQAGPRMLRQGARLLAKFKRRGGSYEAHDRLTELLAAFSHEVARDAARLFAVLEELLGSEARTVSDQIRAARAGARLLVDGLLTIVALDRPKW